MSVEQVKVAYRCAYSLFDKIAYFIRKLGIPERGVNFRSVWVEPARGKAPPQVRTVLEGSENLPLRGLFRLSKDLFDSELKDVAQPEARDLDTPRNHLEHKNVKVVDSLARNGTLRVPFVDRLAHPIVREDLEQKTLRLLQRTYIDGMRLPAQTAAGVAKPRAGPASHWSKMRGVPTAQAKTLGDSRSLTCPAPASSIVVVLPAFASRLSRVLKTC